MPSRPLQLKTTQDFDAVFSAPPVLSSEGLGWQGIQLEYRWEPASSLPEMTTPWHMLSFVSEAPQIPTVQRCFNGKVWDDQAHLGEAVILPAHSAYGLDWDTEGYFMAVAIDPKFLAQASDPSLTVQDIEIVPNFSKNDPLLYQLALGLRGILQAEAQDNRLYAESLGNTLMLHLLQNYTTQNKSIQPLDLSSSNHYVDGFSSVQRQQILDYIHTHLDQNLGLKELADLVQLSPHYFAHLFKQSMHIAPHQYVIQQRVERAKQLLKQSNLSAADVAYQVGFANQAHLNRHFKKWMGVTPGQYRRGV